MTDELYELPDGWKWATVADVISDAQPGFASGKKDVPRGINHLRMNNIGANCQLNLDSVFTVPNELAKPRYLAQLNDVLVCHTNSTKLVGKAALFNVPGVYAFSNHLTRLRVAPDIIDPHWLWRVMTTLWRERYFENRCKQWVNQATIERATLLAAPVPLPSLPEQRRIVARIESLFAESRTARDALERVPALLKRFRQSVLASAFRGELTERQTPEVLETSEVSDSRAPLPDGWAVGKLGDLIYIAARIGWRGLKAEEYTQEGPLFLSVHNLNKGERVDFTGAFHISQARYEESPEIQLRDNDILLVKDGAGIGKIGIVKELTEKATVNSSLLVIRAGDVFVPEFLFYFLKGPVMQDVVQQKITGSATPHVFQRDIKKFELLIPPLAEQRRIVAKIESLFAQADAIERAVTIAQKRADKIDQSILARAFRGEL